VKGEAERLVTAWRDIVGDAAGKHGRPKHAPVTHAVDIDCRKCGTPAGTFCNGLGVGADLCRTRISDAARTTREANASVRKAAKR
jgi:hypothetical protein